MCHNYLSLSPGGASGKEFACQCKRHRRLRFNSWVGKIPWRRKFYSSILAGEIPWTEESGGLQSIALQKLGHNWSDLAQYLEKTFYSWLCLKQVKKECHIQFRSEDKRQALKNHIKNWLVRPRKFNFLFLYEELSVLIWTAACNSWIGVITMHVFLWSTWKESVKEVIPTSKKFKALGLH